MIERYWPIAAAVIAAVILWRIARSGAIGRAVLGWCLIALALAAVTGFGLLWLLGLPAVPKPTTFGTTELLELLKIGLAVVAGFGGVVALAVAYRKQRITEEGHDLAFQQDERERAKLFNERFGAAAEQLAHDHPAVRLAGVYAMAGLADDWSAQRQTCVDVLCAYLRLPRPEDDAEDEVVGTILRVIRDRLSGAALWREADFDFTGVTFHDADFGGLIFGGDVTFDRANFEGALTSFNGTTFGYGTTLSCHGTRFAADSTDFRHASFRGAVEIVGGSIEKTIVDMTQMDIRGGRIDIYRCAVTEVSIDLDGTMWAFGYLLFERCRIRASILTLGEVYNDDPVNLPLARLAFDTCELVDSVIDLSAASSTNVRFRLQNNNFRSSTIDVNESSHNRRFIVDGNGRNTASTMPAWLAAEETAANQDATST
ncbi:MAG: hypothetical protein M3548_15530 [Actinomycetota bacterium]|nr:hypothetical protein [Actinomycetota bacterium]